VLVELCHIWSTTNPLFPMFSMLTQTKILLNVKLMHWVEHGFFLFKAHLLLHQQLVQWIAYSLVSLPLMFKMDAKFVWDNAYQQTHVRWKMPRLSISLSYELMVNNLPCTYFVTSCTCPSFVFNVTSSKHSYFLSCNHIYYIHNVHLNLVGNT
jgi:hypothetical protein